MIYGKEEISKKKETGRKAQAYGARSICIHSIGCQGNSSYWKLLSAYSCKHSQIFYAKGNDLIMSYTTLERTSQPTNYR